MLVSLQRQKSETLDSAQIRSSLSLLGGKGGKIKASKEIRKSHAHGVSAKLINESRTLNIL